MDQIGEGIRKLIMAGIGAVAMTKERSEDVLKELVRKGELTVEQGKVLNEELKHNVKEAVRNNVTVNVVKDDAPHADVMDSIDSMTTSWPRSSSAYTRPSRRARLRRKPRPRKLKLPKMSPRKPRPLKKLRLKLRLKKPPTKPAKNKS